MNLAMYSVERAYTCKKVLIICILTFLHLLSVTSAEAAITAALTFDNLSYSGQCPAEIAFNGLITSDKPGKVQYRIITSDGTISPVETIEFRVPDLVLLHGLSMMIDCKKYSCLGDNLQPRGTCR